MSTRALALGMLMPGLVEHEVPGWLVGALDEGVESVCLFGEATGTVARTGATARALRAVRSDVVVTTDEEAGEVTRLEAQEGSSLLSPLALGAIDDPDVTAAAARLSGRLLSRAGIRWTLAPVADVNTDPANPVIGVRSFGGSPDAVAAQVAAWVDGLREVGVSGCVKHFPGHGDTHVDSHESLPVIDKTTAALAESELKPFVAAIEHGVQAVMTGHLLLPALDETNPASLSAAITTDLLRGRLAFDGVIVTDAVEMGAISTATGIGEAAVRAVVAGADLVCIGAADQETAFAECVRAILGAVDDGRIPVERLHLSARRRERLRPAPDVAPGSVDGAVRAVADDVQTLAYAAPRALDVRGDPRVTQTEIVVVRVDGGPGVAAGDSGWSIANALVRAGRHVEVVGLDSGDEVLRFPAATGLVVEVRDAWKRPDLHARLARLLADRPDAVVVDTGWPLPVDPRVRGWVGTNGGGRLASTLAAAVVTGDDPAVAARTLLAETFEEER